MPLYEYECDVCGHRFEIIQKFSDSPVEKCPVCSGPVHKLQSAPAFHLKGSGWYLTDYGKKDQPKETRTEGSSDASSDKKEKEKEQEQEKEKEKGKEKGKEDRKEKDRDKEKAKVTKATGEKSEKADRPASSSPATESTKPAAPKDS